MRINYKTDMETILLKILAGTFFIGAGVCSLLGLAGMVWQYNHDDD